MVTLATTEDSMGRWVSILAPAAQLAERIAGTEFVPKAMRGKPDVVCAAIMYGDELGVGPMQALAGIHVVEGHPQPSAELMRALILRAGHSLVVHEMTGTRARVSGLRAGRPEAERLVVEWTLDMARAAGLMGKSNWRAYPRALLLARASADLARLMFPDVVRGLSYFAEELDEVAALESHDPASGSGDPPRADPRAPGSDVALGAGHVLAEPVPQRKTPARRGKRLPDLPHLPPATVENPAPDRTVDVPLPDVVPPVSVGEGDAPGTVPVAPDLDQHAEPEAETGSDLKPSELRGIMASFRRIGLTGEKERELRLAITSAIVGRDVPSTTQLTHHEALDVIRVINDLETGALTYIRKQDGAVLLLVPDPDDPPPDDV